MSMIHSRTCEIIVPRSPYFFRLAVPALGRPHADPMRGRGDSLSLSIQAFHDLLMVVICKARDSRIDDLGHTSANSLSGICR